MTYAPIVMFVYNRADHFNTVYSALKNCIGAKESEIFIFCDGAKNGEGQKKVDEVRRAVREKENAGDFKEIHITESENNKGLALSVISGVTEVINKYGRVIVLEDDCIASVYFLKFMNECLDKFENNREIGAIAGYAPKIEFPSDYKHDIFTSYRSCSWGWATWKRSWTGVDWELNDKNSIYSLDFVRHLNSNGSDRFIRLYRQTKGNGGSWSVRFGAHLVKNSMMTVYPRYSYIQNIGCDSSGVHSKSEDEKKMSVDLAKAIENPVIEPVKLDNRIQKAMKKHYSGGLVSDIKRTAGTAFIIIKHKLGG